MVASITLYVDMRCFQDPAYASRGIGSHAGTLLGWREQTEARHWRVIGLIDPALPTASLYHQSLCDEVRASTNPLRTSGVTAFLDLSPMTHDSRFALPLMTRRDVLKYALVYDFIPLDWPGYIDSREAAIEYQARLTRLSRASLFFPISQYTRQRLHELIRHSVSRTFVTGVALRPELHRHAGSRRPRSTTAMERNPYVLVSGGADARKNVETAIIAARALWKERFDFRLKILGGYNSAAQERLLALASEAASRVDFVSGIDDARLAHLYAQALVTVVPSHIEGFSIPVIEAAACGSPVLASLCAAHMELVSRPDALFSSGSAEELTGRLKPLLISRNLREDITASQSGLASRFSVSAVASSFWDVLIRSASAMPPDSAPSIARHIRPKLAFFSPYPPQESGVSTYTKLTLEAGSKYFDPLLYTDAPRPLPANGSIRDCGAVTAREMIRRRCDGTLFVLGNSHFHIPIFELHEAYGGPCILHDSRLTHIYHYRYGRPRFLQFAERLLGRPVSGHEIDSWLRDENPASLFIEPIAERASPLIVHTPTLQRLLSDRFSIPAELIPFSPNVYYRSEELAAESRQAARERLRINPETFLLISAGFVSQEKLPYLIIAALDLLRAWDIPAELHFVGSAGANTDAVRSVAKQFGVDMYVRLFRDFIGQETYRDYLLAADAAVQLRAYAFGQASAALTDCISAGLQVVASEDIAESCMAPSYVTKTGQLTSSLAVAEALAACYERAGYRRDSSERAEYLHLYSHDAYARRLCEVLGYA